MHALKLTALSDAQNHEGVDVVDLLPGPIWHIIFRHLLLPPPANSTQKRGNSLGALQQGARSTSFATTRPLSASEQHEENTRRFGSSWPLLRCAMSSKRLFEHVTSFSELQPIALVHNTFVPKWAGSVSWFLKRKAHRSVDLVFNSSADLHSLGQLMASSANSLTSLSLKAKEFADQGKPIEYRAGQLIYPAFLATFRQLQRLKLGRGRWKLGNLQAPWFRHLRSLSIKHLDCNRNDHLFLSDLAPQLHEFSLSSTSHGSTTLSFKFAVARLVTVNFKNQVLDVCFSLPPSLKTFSVTAESLHVDCKCDSPLSLDSVSLVGRKQLSLASLPLASAKTVYMNGPITKEGVSPIAIAFDPEALLQLTASQASLTQLLGSIAPTVEMLTVRHAWPLESVAAEWSRLRRLAVGVNGRTDRGVSYMTTVEDANGPRLLDRDSTREAVTPPFITAPKLESIFFATRLWQPETLVLLQKHFSSLALYRIVGRSFHWEEDGERRRKGPVMWLKPERNALNMTQEDMAQDDQLMRFLQCL